MYYFSRILFILLFLYHQPQCHNALALPPITAPLSSQLNLNEPKKQLLVKDDFIFLEQTRSSINPDYVSVVRPLDFSNMRSLASKLSELRDKHARICSLMQGNAENYTQFVQLPGPGGHEKAFKACKAANMHLPEIRSHEDAFALSAFMRNHTLNECHAGIYYSHLTHTLLYTTNDMDAINPFVTFCDDYTAYNFNPYENYKKHEKDWPHSYWRDDSSNIHLCTNKPELLPIICQAPKINSNDQLSRQASFCNKRTFELDETINHIKASVHNLEDSTRTSQTFTPNYDPLLHTAQMPPQTQAQPTRPPNSPETTTHYQQHPVYYPHNRSKRGLGLISATVSFFSLLLSAISLLRNAATTAKISKSMSALKINTVDIASQLDQLSDDVYTSLDRLQTHAEYVRIENSLYQTFLRLLMNIQDNALSFQQTIQAINYGMITSEILSSLEITNIANEVALTTSQSLSTTPAEYLVKPVIFNSQLAVQIEIPLLDAAKSATIFQVIKYPSFAESKKYVPDCDTTFLAIYDNSNSYNELTTAEHSDCQEKHKRCVTTSPKLSSSVDHCAARQFFNSAPQASIFMASPDSSPFFFSHDSQTIFAVPSVLSLSFHCPLVDIAGPDHNLHLEGRGNFTNPGNCQFNTHDVSFSPPNRIPLDYSPAITSQFQTPELPQLSPQDVQRSRFNIQRTNVLEHLKPVDTDFSFWHAGTIYTTAILLLLVCLILFCVFFQARSIYSRWRQPLAMMRELYSSFSGSPNPPVRRRERPTRQNLPSAQQSQNLPRTQNPTAAVLFQAVENSRSRNQNRNNRTDTQDESATLPRNLNSTAFQRHGVTFQDDSVTFSKRHSLEEAIDMQDELDRMNLTLDNIRPPTLKLSTSETAKILLEPPTPVETDPMLRKSPPPKNFPVRASDSFLNL